MTASGARLAALAVGALSTLGAGAALAPRHVDAGHEMPFYPSYYPQEITVESLDPGAAATRLGKRTLHAWIGGDPFAGRPLPKDVGHAEVLGGYLVVTLNPAAPGFADTARRCTTARKVVHDLSAANGAVAFHPYPVTPYHGDYLHHADLAEAAKAGYAKPATAGPSGLNVRLVARGTVARKVLASASPPPVGAWDAAVEELDLAALLARHRIATNGWLGPPWLKDGWFHAWLAHAETVADPAVKRDVDELYRRLTTGGFGSAVERINLERKLVGLVRAGCERTIVGYTLHRHYFDGHYSDGVENIAWDSHAGFNSHVFLRTVKLKDFPWNGWLVLGVEGRPAAAWNPVGGFTDPAGRLIWAAVGDPGLFPAPYGNGWVANRTTLGGATEGALRVPADALRVDSGTLVPVGHDRTARVKLTLKAWASPFHDGTKTGIADLLYPYVLASRWGTRRAPGDGEYDPHVARTTALARDWLVALRVGKIETDVWNLGDVKLTYENPVVEVYGRYPLGSDLAAAALAPPWSTAPWTVLVLVEEAVKRRLAAFSAEEARRRGLPWLDLVRDEKLRPRLAALLERLESEAHVPEALRAFVTTAEARQRWSALRRHGEEHGHFLVTNGPYRVAKWTAASTVLAVVRDYGYPLGVGTFDRFAIPLRAWVSRVEARGGRLEIEAQAERAMKAGRGYTVEVERVTGRTAAGDRQEVPVCRWIAVGAGGEVVAAGTAELADGRFVVDAGPRGRAGRLRVAVALYVKENAVNPDVKLLEYPTEAR